MVPELVDWPTACLIAACIIGWNVDNPVQFLQSEFSSTTSGALRRQLPVYGSAIRLPSSTPDLDCKYHTVACHRY